MGLSAEQSVTTFFAPLRRRDEQRAQAIIVSKLTIIALPVSLGRSTVNGPGVHTRRLGATYGDSAFRRPGVIRRESRSADKIRSDLFLA
jgi:hypothetical protein